MFVTLPSLPSIEVAEIQGVYGPVTVSERLIQRIWLRGDYQRDGLMTESGRVLRVRRPGRWNLQEGPDFLEAELELDGKRVSGDVEIHFREGDWAAHGHGFQERFDRVILHVVVFPPAPGEHRARTCSGKVPETLVLLPRLNIDLESYAADEALRTWEGRDPASLLEGFLMHPVEERQHRLMENARRRFAQKVAHVRRRLERESWEQVCHQLTLEILGYRRNRAPMSSLAIAHPAGSFCGLDPAALYRSQSSNWKLAGLRPANHPLKRLSQYCTLWEERPDWMARLKAWGMTVRQQEESRLSGDTRYFRKLTGMTRLRRELATHVLGDAIGGTRLDTWMADGALPLLAADDPAGWFGLWYHWFPGDMPELLDRFLKQCDLPAREAVRCNGLLQGAWQVFLESGF